MSQQLTIMKDDLKEAGEALNVSLGGSTAFEALKNKLAEMKASGIVNTEVLRKAEEDGLTKIAANESLKLAERRQARDDLTRLEGDQVAKSTAAQLHGLETVADGYKRGSADQIAALQKAEAFALQTYGKESSEYEGLQRRIVEAQRATGASGAAAAKKEAAAVLAEAQEAARGKVEILALEQAKLKATLDGEVQQRIISQGKEDAILAAGESKMVAAQIAELEREKNDGWAEARAKTKAAR